MADYTTKIGKDVIESLTLGMYEDSRVIFREYIQNSADQIDKAVETNIFSNTQDGKIDIEIDELNKTISFFDNATGIKSSEVESILKNIAKSTKDRTKDKGFRGLGRLGGLAYVDKLIFETSFKGEEIKSFLTWDAKELKNTINNRETREDAASVIDNVTEFSAEVHKKESHYFKVSLIGVNNKIILDRKDICQYLSMVAPVPYNKGFLFKDKIKTKAKKINFAIDEYQIFVKNEQIFKAYTTSIYEGSNGNKRKTDEIYDIESYEIRDSKNELLAWGWHSLSKLTEQMKKINTARGIRLRKGNIQIGSEGALDKLFTDNRWSKYYFGEIHAISPNLIPNGRRDYFLETYSEIKTFEKLIKEKFSELEKLNYLSSKIRSAAKKINDGRNFAKAYKEKYSAGFSDKLEQDKYKDQLQDRQEKSDYAIKELDKIKNSNISTTQQKLYKKIIGDDELKSGLSSIEHNDKKTKYIVDDISKLNRKDKKLVSKIFGIIDAILTPDLSDLLKQKIKEGLK